MNEYLINILKHIESGNFDTLQFVPDESRWAPIKMWYHKYGVMTKISDKKLLDLLYFFYSHKDLDIYEYSHFLDLSQYLQKEYGVSQNDILEMLTEFREIVYEG